MEETVKTKKQDSQTAESTPKTKDRWSIFRNKGQFGEYYSLKKGDLKVSINVELLKRLLKWADERFEKQQKENNKGEG